MSRKDGIHCDAQQMKGILRKHGVFAEGDPHLDLMVDILQLMPFAWMDALADAIKEIGKGEPND